MKKLILRASFLAAAVAAAAMPTYLFAETIIEGNIATSTTWTKEGSPYIVRNHLDILTDATLTVEPGVIVKFDNPFEDNTIYLSVRGKLIANGSAVEPIFMTSFKDDSVGGDDNGDGNATVPINGELSDWVLIVYSPDSVFKNVVMKYSGGLTLDSVSAAINHLTITDSRNGLSANDADMAIPNFRANNIYYNALEIHDGDYDVSNSKISNTYYGSGIYIENAHLNLINSTIENIGTGTDAPVVILNRDAITSLSGQVDVASSTFKGGISTGLRFDDEDFPGLLETSGHISNSSISQFAEESIKNTSAVVIDAANNWWGSASSPEGRISGNVVFTPWLTIDPFATSSATTTPPVATSTLGSSVVFLPGIESSRLYNRGLLSENQLWEPNRNADVEKLYLDQNGQSIDPTIYTRDIIKRTNIGLGVLDKDIYQKFSDTLDGLVASGTINAWEPIPYDWRMDLNSLMTNGIKFQDRSLYLTAEIEKMASSSKTGKVTIITHSNGGLLAKVLIDSLRTQGKTGLIDKLIMIAPPELGTPKAIIGLLHGDEQNIPFVLSKPTARKLAENMISAYNLLPSQKYFTAVQNPVIEFDTSVDNVNNFRSKYGNNIKNYQALSDFLLAKKDNRAKPIFTDVVNPNILNANFETRIKNTHNQIDDWIAPAGLEVIKVAGWGIPTTRGIEYLGKENCILGVLSCAYVLDHQLLKTIDGDGTVVTPSINDTGAKLYLNVRSYNSTNNQNLRHANILEADSLNTLVQNIMKDSNSSLPPNISSTKPTDSDNQNLEIGAHSPVSINAYDSLGNHTGLASSSNSASDLTFVEENIPNSSYEEIGEGKYLILGGGNYRIKLTGLDLGSFTLNEKIKKGDTEIIENVFADIPTTPEMVAELNISATSSPTIRPVLAIDIDGDGLIDATTTPATEINPAYYLLLMKKIIADLDINNGLKIKILNKIDNLLKLISQGKIKNATKKIKAFNHNLEQKIAHHKAHNRHINREDAEILADLLNKLLDALPSN